MEPKKKYNPDLKENLIVNLSFHFALDIVRFTEELECRRKFAIANQIIKSGTSIGANIREAQNAESKADFIHKIKVEADETEYWLELRNQSENYPACQELLDKILSIKKVLSKIISTSKSSTNYQINESSNQNVR